MRCDDPFFRVLFVKCDRGVHAIELYKEHNEDFICLDFWWYMGHNKMPFRKRLKAIWNILIRGGGCLFEEITLSKEKAKELKTYLEEVLHDE